MIEPSAEPTTYRETPNWKRNWLVARAAAGSGIGIVLLIVILYGELDWSWVIALVLTVIFVGGMAAVLEKIRARGEQRSQGS